MRRLKITLVTALMAFGALSAFAAPANAVVCVEDTSACCGPITILGKEHHWINC